MKRNPNIELYRCLMMLGIVMLHIFAIPEVWRIGGNKFVYVLMPCVDGFALISGYFGVRFSFVKLAKLYLIALWSVLIVCLIRAADVGCSVYSGEFWRYLVCVFKEYWFLHAYALMMCLAPLINQVLEIGKPYILVPFLVAVFGVGFLGQVAGIHHFIPYVPGLEPKSGLTLAGVYVVGRVYRGYEKWFDARPIVLYVISLIAMSLTCSLGLGWFGLYDSPIAICVAICMFHLFRHARISGFLGRMCMLITPSIFAIYILHANEYVYGLAGKLLHVLSGGGLMVPMVASIVFVVAVCADALRRIVLRLLVIKLTVIQGEY